MSGKIHYYDHLDQGDHSVLGRDAHAPSPLEELMEREERAEVMEEGSVSAAWLLEVFLEWVFADERPMDWRYAGRRGLALLREFCPGLLVGRGMVEAEIFKGLTDGGRFAQDSLMAAAEGHEEELRRMVGMLLRWIYQEPGKRWMEKGAWRLYVLASRYHGRALKRWEDAKVINGQPRAGRWRDMSYADFAEAFGEGDCAKARARWSYRAGQILEGIPQVPGAKTQEAREKMRQAAQGNGNRKGKKKNSN